MNYIYHNFDKINMRIKIAITIYFFYLSLQSIADTITTPTVGDEIVVNMEAFINKVTMKNSRVTAIILPGLGYDPEAGWELGLVSGVSVKPIDSTSIYYRPSTVTTYFSYSTNNWFRSKLEMKWFTSKGLYFNILTRFMNTPDTFWGIGNDNIPDINSEFTLRNWTFNAIAGKSFKNKFYLGVNFDLSIVNTLSITDSVLNNSISGYSGGSSFGVGPFLRYDTRDNVNYPFKGLLVDASYTFFPKFIPNDYNMLAWGVSVSNFKTLISDLIMCTNFSLNITEGNTPFYKMPQLAGNSYLRGISNRYKYIDNSCWYVQTEFRKHLFWRFGMAAFGGIGNTFYNLSDKPFHNIKWVSGIGGRITIAPKERLNLRADIGFGSNNDYGVYLSVSEAF